MKRKFEMVDIIKKDILNFENEILDSAKYIFGNLEQEDIILMLNDLILDKNIEISSIDFMETNNELLIDEDEEEDNLDEEEAYEIYPESKVHSVKITYKTAYEDLIDFLKNIREYEKKIIIRNIDINNNHDGNLSGSFLMDFYTLDTVDKYHIMNDGYNFFYYGQDLLDHDDINNPFNSYEEFMDEEDDEVEDVLAGEDYYIEKRIMTDLYGFENENIFFVGKPKDVYGKVLLDTNSIQGSYSNRIEYDFIRPREYSEVNLVFEGKPIEIKRQPELISISVYPYETNDHNIGIILIDAYGKEFKLSITSQLALNKWNTVDIIPPIEITYPAILQRIYIESNSFSDKLKGDFSFDKLQLLYNEN
ncbi:MAG: hypothetical protein GX214_01000 [Clostridiales bacterium]|nr:hypothetical protein [Clostridiales bacterium]